MMRKLVLSVAVAALLLAGCASENTEAASVGSTPRAHRPLLDGIAADAERPARSRSAPTSPHTRRGSGGTNDSDERQGLRKGCEPRYAIAKQLGYSTDQVKWVVEPFNKSYAPGAKDFDFDINQISITPQREKAVDFSDGYYDVNQALDRLEQPPSANAKSIADLKSCEARRADRDDEPATTSRR